MFKLLDKGDEAIWWFFQGPYEFMIPVIQTWMSWPIEVIVVLLAS